METWVVEEMVEVMVEVMVNDPSEPIILDSFVGVVTSGK